jgi:hypothetical protein
MVLFNKHLLLFDSLKLQTSLCVFKDLLRNKAMPSLDRKKQPIAIVILELDRTGL